MKSRVEKKRKKKRLQVDQEEVRKILHRCEEEEVKKKPQPSRNRSEPFLPHPLSSQSPPAPPRQVWRWGVGFFFVCWPVSRLFVTVSDLMLRPINHAKAPPLVCTVHTPVSERRARAKRRGRQTNYREASSTRTQVISFVYFFFFECLTFGIFFAVRKVELKILLCVGEFFFFF